MKKLLAVLAAAGVAGVSTYAVLELTDKIFLDINGRVLIDVRVFVASVVGIGLAAGALALAFEHLISKSDNPSLAALDQRIARLEGERAPRS
ncbi:MAG: hypothetical protein U1F36_14295 [Planctomycetota bacterium]